MFENDTDDLSEKLKPVDYSLEVPLKATVELFNHMWTWGKFDTDEFSTELVQTIAQHWVQLCDAVIMGINAASEGKQISATDAEDEFAFRKNLVYIGVRNKFPHSLYNDNDFEQFILRARLAFGDLGGNYSRPANEEEIAAAQLLLSRLNHRFSYEPKIIAPRSGSKTSTTNR